MIMQCYKEHRQQFQILCCVTPIDICISWRVAPNQEIQTERPHSIIADTLLTLGLKDKGRILQAKSV